MKGHFIQIHQWFSAEGECHLQEAESVETSGDRMEQVLNSFTGFLIEANDRRHHALSLVSEAERLQQRGLSYPETETFRAFLCTFKSKLEDFLCRAEARGRELQLMVNVCDFCEQAMELASACTDYLNQCLPRIQSVQDPESVSGPQQQNKNPLFQSDASHVSGPTSGPPLSPDRLFLQSFQEKFLQFSPEKFQEMKVQASALRSYRGMQVWNIAHPRCQEAQQLLQERMQDLDTVYSQQADLSSCSEGHFVDVVSTNVQTAPPGGQKLVVQSTSGVHHPQRLQHVMEELVFTEREYVRSLAYILTHYLPLMDRLDIPQDLRGKRGVIFGNLEKLHDFHGHYFLPELEACERQPSAVARCFLRHSESFGLYALYSKNKPQSDALILHRRHDIFKKKQQELGDMMDLSSYLLRPIQRISKYSLLLQDMLALVGSRRPKAPPGVCGLAAHASDLTCTETDRESADIQTAADLIQFQMRHGNDLLTMDAIQDCDVNLKEQGQLIRQDEFTVFFRKKKCVRRIFLFEHLVLFSKSKRTDVGNDVYVYKQSFKTSDIGMTHNSGMGSLCFEIWFRRRKSEDTYTLKASGIEVKQAWTTDLERILWDQAAHSRELRLQERVFMGMGYKPFMDIQPSDAAISDRAVGYVHPGRVPVACCSHRGLEYPRPRSIGSGSTASTTLSQSSSSSGRGSLPPAGYPGNLSHGMDANPAVCVSTEAMADNELNSHRLHQHHPLPHCDQWSTHCPLMNSTESPGVNTNLFNRSDSCCLSALSGEVVDDSSVASRGSERKPPLCRTPSLRKNGSSAASGKKPVVPPKPPHLDTTQGKLGKSTEV
uniref:Quattro n=1 Tax=Nothobranchius kuhntae TaxID=321403 RepID=A0A1A8KNG1_NOTKU